MRVIIEGPSNSGKTKLAKLLSEKYDLSYCHMTKEDYMSYDFLSQTLLKKDVVWDRHFISELVYSIIYDRDTSLSSNDMKNLMNICNNLNIKVIIMVPKNATEDDMEWYTYFGGLFDNALFFKQGTNLSLLDEYLERNQ